MRILLSLFSTLILFDFVSAQYVITTNPKCMAALEEKSQKGDPSLKSAINFIETAQNGTYTEWHSLVSQINENEVQELKAKEWWHYLSSDKLHYYIIAEQRLNTAENKIIYFKSQIGSEKEKILKIHVVKENNEWKVRSFEL
jgi:hypothetical protein